MEAADAGAIASVLPLCIIVSAEAIVGAALAYAFLGETLSLIASIGALLIATGIIAIQFPPSWTARFSRSSMGFPMVLDRRYC